MHFYALTASWVIHELHFMYCWCNCLICTSRNSHEDFMKFLHEVFMNCLRILHEVWLNIALTISCRFFVKSSDRNTLKLSDIFYFRFFFWENIRLFIFVSLNLHKSWISPFFSLPFGCTRSISSPDTNLIIDRKIHITTRL